MDRAGLEAECVRLVPVHGLVVLLDHQRCDAMTPDLGPGEDAPLPLSGIPAGRVSHTPARWPVCVRRTTAHRPGRCNGFPTPRMLRTPDDPPLRLARAAVGENRNGTVGQTGWRAHPTLQPGPWDML